MALDPTRAALVTQEFRYATNEDSSILATFPQATIIEIDTTLDATGGAAMSTAIFNAAKSYARVFQVTIEGVLYPEDFIGGAPRYVVNFLKHPAAGTSTTYTVIQAAPDYFANVTNLTVRG